MKNNPEEIIEWAEAEIKKYKKLIKIIKKHGGFYKKERD